MRFDYVGYVDRRGGMDGPNLGKAMVSGQLNIPNCGQEKMMKNNEKN